MKVREKRWDFRQESRLQFGAYLFSSADFRIAPIKLWITRWWEYYYPGGEAWRERYIQLESSWLWFGGHVWVKFKRPQKQSTQGPEAESLDSLEYLLSIVKRLKKYSGNLRKL